MANRFNRYRAAASPRAFRRAWLLVTRGLRSLETDWWPSALGKRSALQKLPALNNRLAPLLTILAASVLVTLGSSNDASAQYFSFGKNRVQYDRINWEYIETDHFDVYYDGELSELGRYAALNAEESYRTVAQLLQYSAVRRIPLIIYGNHDDFGVTNAVELPDYVEGIGGVTELYKNRIAVPFTGDYRAFDHVVRHEIVHALLNDLFYAGTFQSLIQKNIRFPIPAWFNEGLAEFVAAGWTSDADQFIGEAVLSDNLPPIELLTGAFAYKGGQSVWDYIAAQYGTQKIGEIVHVFRMTHSVDAAFRRTTGLSLREHSVRWRESLKQIYFPEVAARDNIEYIARRVVYDRNAYHSSPALSPRGDRIAYLSSRSGLFDLYVQRVNTGVRTRLIRGQVSTSFESLPILSPGISWSPDGRRIAVAVKTGKNDAITVVDVITGRSRAFRVSGVDQILSISWSPAGEQIAMAATNGARSDLYVMDLESNELKNFTNDWYSDHEPSFSPDGSKIVFHSDRENPGETTEVAVTGPEAGTQFDLFELDVATGQVTRLTNTPEVSEHTARYAGSGSKILFVSAENGIENLYELDSSAGINRPVTNLLVGISQMALSSDGSRAALVSFRRSSPAIYVLANPLDRIVDEELLTPNVYAQRKQGPGKISAPASVLAVASVLRENPFLRDAVDSESRRNVPVSEDPWAMRLEHAPPIASRDTSRFVSVGFPDQTGPTFSLDYEGEERPIEISAAKRYRLRFSPDLAYGTAGYDVLYGVQGVTQMVFSDLLGDHRFTLSTNLLIDLRNLDYEAAYHHLPRRTDWTIAAFQSSRLLRRTSGSAFTYDRFRQVGLSLKSAYPLDKFRRIEGKVSFVRASQSDIAVSAEPARTRSVASLGVAYVRDLTTPGLLGPTRGKRLGLSVAGSPVPFGSSGLRFANFVLDSRIYETFRSDYTIALRFSGGLSFGRDRQKFYSGGVANWANRRFDVVNGFPINDVSDFVFATPVLPLRGADLNQLNGGAFGLVNLEMRFPLFTARAFTPTALLPLYRLHGAAFLDIGSIYSSSEEDQRFNFFQENEAGEREFDDLFAGMGVGLRTIVLGYPLRFDVAWPYNGNVFGDRQYYLSVGFDF